jgi:hypothetical protein
MTTNTELATIESFTPTKHNNNGLNSDMWTKCYAMNSNLVGKPCRVVGLTTVYKVAEYDGKRWAWIGIGEEIKLKVYEGSTLSKRLRIGWKRGKSKPVVTRSVPVTVDGILHQLADGTFTMHHARVAGSDFQAQALNLTIGIFFETQYVAAGGSGKFLKGLMKGAAANPKLAKVASDLMSKIAVEAK